jgi:tetratricopeptide (TPR) repeat protein
MRTQSSQSFTPIRDDGHSKLIVFVHGFLGDESTFRNSASGLYWPRMIRADPDFDHFDIFAYNYESTAFGRQTIEDVAQAMLDDLGRPGILNRYDEIHFIAHSLGGLVTKRMLNELQLEGRLGDLERVKTVLYLSTPAQGAPLARYLAWLTDWMGLNPQLANLRPLDLNMFLQTLENQWLKLLSLRDGRGASVPRSYCAHETKPTYGVTIVSRIYSATRCDNIPSYAIPRDHFDIAKPADTEDEPYVWSKRQILGSRPSHHSLPRPIENRFSVAIAHLEHDTRGELERLIASALSQLEGIEIVMFDRTISLEGARPQERIRTGHDQAREYLRSTGVDLVIWGRVLRRDGVSIPQLYWTPSRELDSATTTGHYDPVGVEMPARFWADFAEVLRLIVTAQHAELRAAEEVFVADRLDTFIVRVRRLLEDSKRLWGGRSEADVRFVLAKSLLILGEQRGSATLLSEGVSALRKVLEEYSRHHVPIDRAKAQMNLGVALGSLADLDRVNTYFEEALTSFREGIQEFPRDRFPREWANGMNNIGVTLMRLGESEPGTARLEEAVTTLRGALAAISRDRMALDWARTQSNLGGALTALLRRKATGVRPADAVAAVREALKEYTRERTPLAWATTHLNLAAALIVVGEQEGGTEDLKGGVEALRQALTELDPERTPHHRAVAQRNLGAAFMKLSERVPGVEDAQKSVEAYETALRYFSREKFAFEWAITMDGLGVALRILGDRSRTAAYIESSVERHKAALEVFEARAAIPARADALVNLGNSLVTLGLFTARPALFTDAVAAYQRALTIYVREHQPYQWARAQNSLGVAFFRLGQHTGNLTFLQEASNALREALKEFTYGRIPVEWGNTRMNLGGVLIRLGQATSDGRHVLEAADLLCETLLGISRRPGTDLLQRMIGHNLVQAVELLEQFGIRYGGCTYNDG